MSNLIGLVEFHIALYKILLTACADQWLYNLSLIKLYLACTKQKAAVKTTSDACSLLAKQRLSDLVEQHPSSVMINFEQAMKYFLVWNIYFTFYLPVVDYTFLLEQREPLTSLWLEHRRVTSWKYSRSNIAQACSLCYVAGF